MSFLVDWIVVDGSVFRRIPFENEFTFVQPADTSLFLGHTQVTILDGIHLLLLIAVCFTIFTIFGLLFALPFSITSTITFWFPVGLFSRLESILKDVE
jgi:hypothetical protein